MVGFLEMLFSILRNWHVVELRRLRNSAAAMVVLPLIFILSGAFLGGWSRELKVVLIVVGLLLISGFLLWLAARRLPIGAEIATIIKAVRQGGGIVKVPADGVEAYIRFVAAVLTSEVVIGLIALWLRAHQDPPMTFVLLLAALAYAVYQAWQKGESQWPKVAGGIAVFTIFVSAAAISFPQTFAEVTARQERLDSMMLGLLRGDANAWGVLGAVVGVALIAILIHGVRTNCVGRAIGSIVVIAMLLLVVLWLVQHGLPRTIRDVVKSTTATAGWTTPSSPKGVTKHEFLLRPGTRASLTGVVVPRIHCYTFDQYPAGARIFFADGGSDTFTLPKNWGNRHPIALEGNGPAVLWVYDVGTPGCVPKS